MAKETGRKKQNSDYWQRGFSMIGSLILLGWVKTNDGYSISETHSFYVEGISEGVRLIWDNNNVDFYEVGRLYEALAFFG